MTSKRKTGGRFDFVDKGMPEYGKDLTAQDHEKMDTAYERARKRKLYRLRPDLKRRAEFEKGHAEMLEQYVDDSFYTGELIMG